MPGGNLSGSALSPSTRFSVQLLRTLHCPPGSPRAGQAGLSLTTLQCRLLETRSPLRSTHGSLFSASLLWHLLGPLNSSLSLSAWTPSLHHGCPHGPGHRLRLHFQLRPRPLLGGRAKWNFLPLNWPLLPCFPGDLPRPQGRSQLVTQPCPPYHLPTQPCPQPSPLYLEQLHSLLTGPPVSGLSLL